MRIAICALLGVTTGLSMADVEVKRSDVVFMGAKDAEVYQAYGATLVSWGGHAWSESDAAVAQFKQRVDTAHSLGIRYCAGLAFRTAFAGMIDFDDDFVSSVCRTLDAEAIVVPWLWDHEHKGHPAYWFCTNAPGYREYLRHQTRQAMVTDVEGLHIDDYNGTAGTDWRGGCFCPHCMAAFRDYLRDKVPPERLAECGVDSLEGFDYGQFLRDQGVTVDEFRHKVKGSLPLGPEFVTFQYRAAAQWVGEIRAYAEELAGHPLALSVNSSASNREALVIAPQVTYFAGEVGHEAETLAVPGRPIYTFKLCDAVDRPMTCTASGTDWAFIAERSLPGLVRTWIAQAYAWGHQLMAPHRQWAYTKDKGTHWYQSQPSDYADLYQFIRAHAQLFDDYDALARVGLVYSNAATHGQTKTMRDAGIALARANVPFRIVIAGDDWLDERLTADDLAGLDSIVTIEPLAMDDEQAAALAAAADRVATWTAEANMSELVPRYITLAGADKITVVPRAVPGDDARPLVCHLLNRNYDGERDAVTPQTDFTVELQRTAVNGAQIRAATLFAPGAEPVALDLTQTDDALTIHVNRVDLWGVVRLDRTEK
jgi:hypothetical protein